MDGWGDPHWFTEAIFENKKANSFLHCLVVSTSTLTDLWGGTLNSFRSTTLYYQSFCLALQRHTRLLLEATFAGNPPFKLNDHVQFPVPAIAFGLVRLGFLKVTFHLCPQSSSGAVGSVFAGSTWAEDRKPGCRLGRCFRAAAAAGRGDGGEGTGSCFVPVRAFSERVLAISVDRSSLEGWYQNTNWCLSSLF